MVLGRTLSFLGRTLSLLDEPGGGPLPRTNCCRHTQPGLQVVATYAPFNTAGRVWVPEDLLGFRQFNLRHNWGFTCNCEMCVEGNAVKAATERGWDAAPGGASPADVAAAGVGRLMRHVQVGLWL
jgi:hypothetical protein